MRFFFLEKKVRCDFDYDTMRLPSLLDRFIVIEVILIVIEIRDDANTKTVVRILRYVRKLFSHTAPQNFFKKCCCAHTANILSLLT